MSASQWESFNWPNIVQEARARYAEHLQTTAGRADYDLERDRLEYWYAWCAHANAIATAANVLGLWQPPSPPGFDKCPQCGLNRDSPFPCDCTESASAHEHLDPSDKCPDCGSQGKCAPGCPPKVKP